MLRLTHAVSLVALAPALLIVLTVSVANAQTPPLYGTSFSLEDAR